MIAPWYVLHRNVPRIALLVPGIEAHKQPRILNQAAKAMLQGGVHPEQAPLNGPPGADQILMRVSGCSQPATFQQPYSVPETRSRRFHGLVPLQDPRFQCWWSRPGHSRRALFCGWCPLQERHRFLLSVIWVLSMSHWATFLSVIRLSCGLNMGCFPTSYSDTFTSTIICRTSVY